MCTTLVKVAPAAILRIQRHLFPPQTSSRMVNQRRGMKAQFLSILPPRTTMEFLVLSTPGVQFLAHLALARPQIPSQLTKVVVQARKFHIPLLSLQELPSFLH